MDDLEFRKRAIIDPHDQTAEFLEKTRQSNNNQKLVEQQRHFDQQLSETLRINTPDNLAERIILNQQLAEHKASHQHIRQKTRQRKWFMGSIAASIFAITLSFILWPALWTPATIDGNQLAEQVLSHYYQDTHALNVDMNVAKNNIDTMLASYGGKLNDPIGQVAFLGHCIVGGHTGVHLVLNTPQGQVTVLILPTQPINHTYPLHDQQISGIVYPSKKGSIAILTEHAEVISSTRQRLDSSLNWII